MAEHELPKLAMRFLERVGLCHFRSTRVPFASVNACAYWLTRLEQMLGRACRFPIGSSLFAVLRDQASQGGHGSHGRSRGDIHSEEEEGAGPE